MGIRIDPQTVRHVTTSLTMFTALVMPRAIRSDPPDVDPKDLPVKSDIEKDNLLPSASTKELEPFESTKLPKVSADIKENLNPSSSDKKAAPVAENENRSFGLSTFGIIALTVAAGVNTVIGILGIPFLIQTWRKRQEEATERKRTNYNTRHGLLIDSINLNAHCLVQDASGWKLTSINKKQLRVDDLFLDKHEVFTNVLKEAARRCSPQSPFVEEHFTDVLQPKKGIKKFMSRLELPALTLMKQNTRQSIRDIISEIFNPDRKSLIGEECTDRRRVFGILVCEKGPHATSLVLRIITERDLRMFADEQFVNDLKKNTRKRVQEISRIDQLRAAYLREKDFLDDPERKDRSPYYPCADVIYPKNGKNQDTREDRNPPIELLGNGNASGHEKPKPVE